MRGLRGKLTFSNVIACVALFVALGGASYAAFQLPRNSVGAKHLKKGAVTPAKLSAGALSQLGEGQGFASKRNFQPVPFGNGEQGIASLSLPAGSFIFNAYAVALSEFSEASAVSCDIVLGNRVLARSEAVSLGPANGMNRALIAITGGGTLQAPGTATLVCGAETPAGKWFEEGMTAVQVSSIGN
jgi:hypothetical protein